MESYVGHDKIVEELSDWMPHVALFVGPPSVGKATLATQLPASERYYWNPIGVETAKTIVQIARMAPASGDTKLLVINITVARQEALDVLLLALEDSPHTTKFILVSDTIPSETITSRCHVYHFGLLTEDEVYRVLTEVKHYGKDNAAKIAARANGQIAPALALAKQEEDKLPVLSVLRAFRERDPKILDNAADSWTEIHTQLLQVWAREALTGRWRLFNEAESGISGKKIPLQILIASRASIRPKLMVRSKLMKVLRGL